MRTIPIDKFPISVKIAGLDVNLRKRVTDFLRGSAMPVGGIYHADVVRWIEWEKMPIINTIIGI